MTESRPKPTSATLPAPRPEISATAASKRVPGDRQVFQSPAARDQGRTGGAAAERTGGAAECMHDHRVKCVSFAIVDHGG